MPGPSIESIYPLTASQQGMLLESFRARIGIHVEQNIFELHAALDTALFDQAWRAVVARHAILRSAFSWDTQAEPVQVVLREVELGMTIADWREQPAAQQAERLDEFLAADRARGFAVKRAPLIRLSLFRIADRVHRFVFSFHHIVLDGWSLSLLLGEAIAIYEALVRGAVPALPPAMPYRAYVAWVRERGQAPAQRYWNDYLRGIAGPTALGREQPCELDRPSDYAERSIRIDESISKAVTALTRQHRITAGLVFQGLWGLVLSRYSGQHDVLFGTTVSGRPAELPGALSAVGLFINTVPMRLAPAVDMPLWSWLQQVQTEHTAGRDFEHCSTGQIHRWREAGAAAATYDSLLVYENYPDHAVANDASLRIDALASRTVGARTGFAATLLIGSLAGFWIKLIFQRRRFDDAAVPLILGHLRMMVERIAAEPTVRVGALLAAIPDAEIPVVYSQPALLSPEQRRWVGPRDVTELKLAKLWQNILRCDLVGAYDNFFDLGGHSLLALDLMARIEDEFGVRLPMSALLQHPTIEAVARQLRERSAPQPWSALVPIRASGGRTPLFCVPGAAIDAISLHPLAHALGDDQPFYGIQPRGLDSLLAPHATVEAMAAEVVEAMRSVQPRGPYYIAGHSFGAHIAYEVSQQLGDAGCEVGLLTLLDAEASTLGLGPAAPARTSMDRLGRLLSLVHRFFGHDVALAVDPNLPPDELIEHVAVRLAEAKILPTGLGAKRVKSYLAVGEATSLAFDAYRPACRHPVDTLLVRAREIHREDYVLGGANPDDEALGWRRLVGRDVTVSWVAGDHVTIMTRPNVQTMADLLLEAMRQPHALPRRRQPAPEVGDGAR